jgi:uncharacterized damage-inducible protein DinB
VDPTQRILRQYDGVMEGPAWHGDPIWEILDGISAHQAAARPVAGIHSIWEILMHMKFWEEVVILRLAGQRAGLIEERNFPPVPEVTEAGWHSAREEFRESNRRFREALAKVAGQQLDEKSAAGKRTFYEEAHGVIEHSVYHAGQIALLKKAVQG